jgi:hypothetical protein
MIFKNQNQKFLFLIFLKIFKISQNLYTDISFKFDLIFLILLFLVSGNYFEIEKNFELNN